MSGPGDREASATGPMVAPAAPADPAARTAAFAPGCCLASRYLIVRFLARGGMGEVYEAQDVVLGKRIAIKAIRSEFVNHPGALERFRREILLAQKVTHPNVCRIFDLAYQDVGAHEVPFLTMELVIGETLAQRIRRLGRLPAAEVLAIATQLAAALDAAHEAQVLHRDFKSANVLLVERPPGATVDPRAVVTDFGLARLLAAQDDTELASMTGGAAMLGTPAYMAPEQVEGKPVTRATDIYAFGVVLYEMLTGHVPFEEGTSLTTAVARVKGLAPSPRIHVPTLGPAWEAAILRCLAMRPDDRFATAGAALAALAAPAARPGRRVSRVAALGLLVAAGAAAAFVALAAGHPSDERARPAAPVDPHGAVAVLGFKNASGRAADAWVSTALVESLTGVLGAGDDLKVIPPEDVGRARREVGLDDDDALPGAELQKLAGILGARYLVLGSYHVGQPGHLELELRLQDAETGATLVTRREEGSPDDPMALATASAPGLRAALGRKPLDPVRDLAVRSPLPDEPRARRLYAAALSKRRAFQPAAARDLLLMARGLDPRSPLIHAALAGCLADLGYTAQATDELKLALDSATDLPAPARGAIEARYRRLSGDPAGAELLYRKLSEDDPENLDHVLGLADALNGERRTADALAVLEDARRRSTALRDDPRLDLAEAQVARSNDFRRAADAAARAGARARGRGATLLLAAARSSEGFALTQLGDEAGAAAALDEAAALYRAAGNVTGEADVLNGRAQLDGLRGDHRAAKAHGLAALAGVRALGNPAQMLGLLHGVALNEVELGEAASAEATCAEADRIFERKEHDPKFFPWCRVDVGRALISKGDLAAARPLLAEAYDLGNLNKEFRLAAAARAAQGELELLEDDLAGSRQDLVTAARLFHELGMEGRRRFADLLLARVALEDGHAAEAEKLAHAFLTGPPEGKPELRNDAWSVLAAVLGAAALADQGHLAQARAALPAEAEVHAVQAVAIRFYAEAVAARLRADPGAEDAPAALATLEALRVEAALLGAYPSELELRLAIGHLELGAHRVAKGQALLAALEKDARAHGFRLIAREAAQARVARPRR